MAQTKTGTETLWRFAVRLREGFLDAEAKGLLADIADLGVEGVEEARVARVYYVRGPLSPAELKRLGEDLLADPITEEYELNPVAVSDPKSVPGTSYPVPGTRYRVEVAYRPGVRDPVEDSLKKGARDLGITTVEQVHTAKEYGLSGPVTPAGLERITEKLLVNATIQQVVTPETRAKLFQPPAAGAISIETVHLLQAGDTVLQRVSLDYQLSLNLEEMRAIQQYFRKEGREPTLIELETLAQTWSEHCKHKTLRGEVVYTEEAGGKTQKRVIRGLLKETIMKATRELAKPWCVSVFEDNSGVIGFDDEYHVCFKVETHNHPSALEPFGGANTGVGGVIRDILGTGLGAKPVASTDVFCFARPDYPAEEVPPGSLHPRRIIKGVVSGVRDYGNKMGIPTVNGAVLFDDRFVGNPLVYCGSVGLIPADKVRKKVEPGMAAVVVGGRTGRDGVHGATFSSLTLTPESEVVSSTAVQIGDPITEKKMADALLEARDLGLFSAVTDCGAGGLSSAVGEMGAGCGARVELEKVPLKYAGLTPAEIWISESQERMVLAAPQESMARLLDLFRRREVEAVAIGEFTGTGRLELLYKGARVGELAMEFLHDGVPQITRPARWAAPRLPEPSLPAEPDLTKTLLQLLGSWDTCSKEWIIRRYDHEVQGGSVLKPLVEGGSPFDKTVHPEFIEGERSAQGKRNLGPSDAAVIRPRLDSAKGLVLANGINFRYGDLDPYQMAALAIDEAARQVVAVGGNLDHLAILDNFCWGDPTRIEVLGSLVRAALGCCDAAKAYGTPFISGKDSLHNEYRMPGEGGAEKTIQIPGTLLISAIGVIPDAARVISMDAKRAGSFLYIAGVTRRELGGSSYHALRGAAGGAVPQVDLEGAPKLLGQVSRAIAAGLAASAHDCSEGGLGVAAAEMAFAGGLGLTLDLRSVPLPGTEEAHRYQVQKGGFVPGTEEAHRYQVQKGGFVPGTDVEVLFSESATRLLLEVPADKAEEFEKRMAGFPAAKIGRFEAEPVLRVTGLSGKTVVEAPVQALREAWEAPFKTW